VFSQSFQILNFNPLTANVPDGVVSVVGMSSRPFTIMGKNACEVKIRFAKALMSSSRAFAPRKMDVKGDYAKNSSQKIHRLTALPVMACGGRVHKIAGFWAISINPNLHCWNGKST